MYMSCNHQKTKYHSLTSNTDIIVLWHRTPKYHHSSQPRLYWCGYAYETQLQFQPWLLQGLRYDQLSNITDFRLSSQLSFDSFFLTRLEIHKATRGNTPVQCSALSERYKNAEERRKIHTACFRDKVAYCPTKTDALI